MRAPPAVPVALAFGAGILASTEVHLALVFAVAALIHALPIPTSIRPYHRALIAAGVGGSLVAWASWRVEAADCRWRFQAGVEYRVEGRFAGRTDVGAGTFILDRTEPGSSCSGRVRARLLEGVVPPGRRVAANAKWTAWSGAERPERAGTLMLSEPEVLSESSTAPGAATRLRGALLVRVDRVFGASAPTVDALILARKERLDPALREAYARSGAAHLLAISGFHVGVVAALLAAGAGVVGAAPRFRSLIPAAGVWMYVLVIGAPPAAVRAAAIGSVLAASRLRGRPASRTAGLATVLLGYLMVRPLALMDIGFQLSFAGAAGLVAVAPGLDRSLAAWWPRLTRSVRSALSVSVAASFATAPIVAWHFGELPLLGLPMTALLTPLVAAAIVGSLGSLALDCIHPILGAVPAGGTALLLDVAAAMVGTVSREGWVVIGAGRSALIGGVVGWVLGWVIRPSAWDRRRETGRGQRPAILVPHMAACVLAGVLIGPALEQWAGRTTGELVAIDVGQGDAIAIRSPAGRWLLVDAGPASARFDAGASRVLPYLESRNVRALEALVVTHADMDHFGGAASVLRGISVRRLIDPGIPAAKVEWRSLIRTADSLDVPWSTVQEAESWKLDGLGVDVWRPSEALAERSEGSFANAASLIVVVRYGQFTALLTGDAPVPVEEAVAAELGNVDVLKVGHHGSRTSTSAHFLDRTMPEVALISVGRRNRYGHPDPSVLQRLRRSGARTLRTDQEGTIRVRFKSDGRYWVSTR